MKINVTQFAVLVVFCALLLVASPTLARVVVDDQGRVISQLSQVLSSGSGGSDDSDNSGSGSGDGSDDSSGSSSDDSDEDADEAENEVEDEDEAEIEDSNDDGTDISLAQVPAVVLAAAQEALPGATFTKAEVETTTSGTVYKLRGTSNGTEYEVRVSSTGTVLRTEQRSDTFRSETRDDRERTEIVADGTRVRLEREGDEFRLKVEGEDGEETEIEGDDILTVEERADHNQIRIRTFSTSADQARNRAIVERLNTQALTDLPLSINLETNELTVTTPAGERVVAVLPDQAVQNMLAANVIDRIGGQQLADIIEQSGVEALERVIELTEEDGVPVYEIEGAKDHRLLGFFPVTTDVTVTVSAETGEVVATHQSVLDTIIDLFSRPA